LQLDKDLQTFEDDLRDKLSKENSRKIEKKKKENQRKLEVLKKKIKIENKRKI